jgi:predicted unusual protein kinase regulating ubiquinone biosynthesis (AarF/ABC1/UbiB family)
MKLLPSFHLKRYRQIAALLWKYGRTDLARQMSEEEGFGIEKLPSAEGGTPADTVVPAADPTLPEQLADDLEAMGPTFIKLGQILAGRPDLLPDDYLKALARLQDRVKPFPYAQVDELIMAELGVRVSKAYPRFDVEPVAAASLGQVHRAALRDGREVVVKVQRPNIRKQIAEDFEVLEQIAGFLDGYTSFGRRHRFLVTLKEFRLTIQEELNYEREAHNLIALGKNLKDFAHIQVPQPIPDYYSRSILTMEEVQGKKINSVGPLELRDLDGKMLAEELFKSYLHQVLVDGLFHADPHPGNVFITNDGRIALIDLGMVGHTSPAMQENLVKLLLAISEGNGDGAAEVAIRMSEKLEEFAAPEFRRSLAQLVARRRDQGLEQLRVGRSLLEVSKIAQENGLIVPSELVLLGKTMLQLEEIGRNLDPEFDADASIRRHVAALVARRMSRDLSQGSILSTLIETRDFTIGLPSRLNRILEAVTNSEMEVRVKATDAKMVMDGLHKIANRITMGIMLAGMIVGASLLARVTTQFQILGYPGLAMLCFIASGSVGVWLVARILVSDFQSRKRTPR